MPWRLARVALALGLCAAFVAGARADDEKPKGRPKPKLPDLPPHFKKCFDAVIACGKACNEAYEVAKRKVNDDGEKKYDPPRRWIIDCGQTCQLTAYILVRQGPGHKIACEACARMCDECARACKGLEDDELKECARQCAACARACRDLIKGHKAKPKEGKKDAGGDG